MAHAPDELLRTDIEAYLAAHEEKSLLRFITCGSVDDGKSTLIGRLLYESKVVFEDHLQALAHDSRKVGTQGGEIDFALLLDGLEAEREQGITIDVAYRFFTTEKRKFIVADTPGHEQYTRNMVTGASTADLAVILVDARKGVLTQTRRHSYLVSLLGIPQIVLAVNKIDLVDYSQRTFVDIESEYRELALGIGLNDVTCIPLSALRGDNITALSENTPWYTGPTLMDHLESVKVDSVGSRTQFRMPVQWVNRPNSDFRGYSGTIAAGTLAVGDRIRIAPSGLESTVTRIVTFDGDLDHAVAGESVTVCLADEIDISRGDVLSAASDPIAVADQFEADIVWMSDHAMVPGRRYLMKIGTRTVGASTIANIVEQRLHADGIHTTMLDGDNVRHGLNRDLGFTEADRIENIRRIAEVAKLMTDAGLVVLVSFISPFKAERDFARGLVGEGEFCEVHVDTPLAVAEQRDAKGLYAKARRGELPNFTGIDSPYEPPESPEVHIDTTLSASEAADKVIAKLRAMGVIPS